MRLGELNLSKDDDGSEPEDYAINRIIVHPDYRYPLKYNDIALLRLNRTVRFTKYIRPACLFTKESKTQGVAVATGWGKTDYLAANTNNILLKVALNVFNNDFCQRAYKRSNHLPEGIKSTMLCAGELKGGRDTCQVTYSINYLIERFIMPTDSIFYSFKVLLSCRGIQEVHY